ncbi:MAG: OsmC family protein [Candidatus Methanomethylicia archaeon]
MPEVRVSLHKGIGLIAVTETGFTITMGGTEETVGANRRYGPSAMELVLAALGGCLSSVTLRILNAKKLNVEKFEVVVKGETMEETPRRYKTIEVEIKAEGIPKEELIKAVELSEKYCPVLWTLKENVEVKIKTV